jgi:hypothetical protein
MKKMIGIFSVFACPAFAFFVLLACLPTYLYAQEGMQDKQLWIEKNKVIELGKASRLQNRMPKTETPPPNTEQVYQNIKIMAVVPPPTVNIKSATYQNQEKITETQTKGNYLKGGFGNYTTILAEGYYALPKSKDYELSFFGQHLSSATGAVLDEKSGASRSKILAQGSYKLNETIDIFAGAGYQRLGVNYYGTNPLVLAVIDKEKIAQTYNIFDIEAGVKIKDENNNYYKIDANYYNFSSKTEVSENAFALNLELKRNLGEKSILFVAANGSAANRKDIASLTRNLITSQAYYQINLDKFYLQAGFNLAYDTDSVSTNNKFRLYPLLAATYTVLPQKLSIFGSLLGNTQRTSLRNFAVENPFLGNQVPLLHTNKQWETTLGINGNILQRFGYQLKTSIGKVQNLYFYNNSKADSTKFTILYDTEGTTVFNLQAEFSAKVNQFKATFKSDFFVYSTTENLVKKAWHRPTFINTLLLQYIYEKKLTLQAELFNQNGLQGYNFVSNKSYNLTNIFDANLQADYQILPNLSTFLKINNLFSQQYQQYLYYDMQQFNALLGLMWRF